MNFDFGPDSGSKPCQLSMEHIVKGNIKLSASEMLSFLRYFGLLIGDFIPPDDCFWIFHGSSGPTFLVEGLTPLDIFERI